MNGFGGDLYRFDVLRAQSSAWGCGHGYKHRERLAISSITCPSTTNWEIRKS